MKNIILGSVFILLFLPQVSFGQTQPTTGNTNQPSGNTVQPFSQTPPPTNLLDVSKTPCNQLDAQSVQFFGWQAGERGQFIQGNPQAIANHDKNFHATLAIDMARRVGKSTAGLPAPPGEDPTFAAFQQKQLSDKQTFLSGFYQAKAACNANAPTTLPTTPTTPPKP